MKYFYCKIKIVSKIIIKKMEDENYSNCDFLNYFYWLLDEFLDHIMIIGLFTGFIYFFVIYLVDILEYCFLVLCLYENFRIFFNFYLVIFWIIYIKYFIYEFHVVIQELRLWYKIFIKKKV
jgi:hypothetical protein